MGGAILVIRGEIPIRILAQQVVWRERRILVGTPPRMRIFFSFHIQFSRSGILCGGTFTVAMPQRNAGSGEVQETAPRFTISRRM